MTTFGAKGRVGFDVDAKCGLKTVVKFTLFVFTDGQRCGLFMHDANSKWLSVVSDVC